MYLIELQTWWTIFFSQNTSTDMEDAFSQTYWKICLQSQTLWRRIELYLYLCFFFNLLFSRKDPLYTQKRSFHIPAGRISLNF